MFRIDSVDWAVKRNLTPVQACFHSPRKSKSMKFEEGFAKQRHFCIQQILLELKNLSLKGTVMLNLLFLTQNWVSFNPFPSSRSLAASSKY